MIKDFLELLQTQGIPVEGFLLAFCAFLVYLLWIQNKKINKLETQNKEKDEMIISLMEKYYVISTKTQNTMKELSNYLIRKDV